MSSLAERVRSILQSRAVQAAFAALLIFGLLLIAYYLGWLSAIVTSRLFWPAVVILLAAATFGLIQFGLPWMREQRFVQAEETEFPVAGQESPQEFRARFLQALENLRRLPRLKSEREPIYALPWYLMIGRPGCGKTSALRASGLFAPLLDAPNGGATRNFELWVSSNAVVVDTTGRYANPIDPNRDKLEWYRLLRLLHHHREREPINGVILCLAADDLVTESEEDSRSQMTRLRDRLEEAVRELGTDFPVYILVTRCDRISGFLNLVGELPDMMTKKALGYVEEGDGRGRFERGNAAVKRIQTALEGIYERLHLIRTAVWQAEVPELRRQEVFRFAEELRAMGPRLLRAVEGISSEDVRYHSPLLRGLFFASAGGGGSAVSALASQHRLRTDSMATSRASSPPCFLADVFDQLLPRDAGLAALTPGERRRRGLAGIFRHGAVIALLGITAGIATSAFLIDRRLASSVDAAECPERFVTGSWRSALAEAERCRRTIEGLIAADQNRAEWSRWISDRTAAHSEALQEKYVSAYRQDVLAGINHQLDESFATATDPLPLVLLLARRISVQRRCSTGPCNDRVAAEMKTDFTNLLGATDDSTNQVNQLLTTYAAYIAWQKGQLPEDLADDRKRLRSWISARQFGIDNLLPMIDRSSPPLTYEAYWQKPAPITAGREPQVSGACTSIVWEEQVAPLLQQVQDAVPDALADLRSFRDTYRRTCLEQWHEFLLHFPEGAQRWKGADAATLTLQLLGDGSPCSRVLDDAVTHLQPWAGDEAWADRLNKYAASEQRRKYAQSLKQLKQKLELGSIQETSYKIAQESFLEVTPVAESASLFLQAWWNASILPADPSGGRIAGDVLPALVQEPLRYVWRTMLDEAGAHLQKVWIDTVTAPLRNVPASQQLLLLYGPGGKVLAFRDQYLQPFLTKEGAPAPQELFGEALPLSPRFTEVLAGAGDLKPTLEGEGPAEPVIIKANGRSSIDAHTRLLFDRTMLAVTCNGKTYRVSDLPDDSAAPASITLPWSAQACGDASISVYFSTDSSSGSKRQLTHTYSGPGGFLQLARDFSGGARRFQLDDFGGVDPAVLESKIVAIEVRFSVEMPPGLSKIVAMLQEPLPDDIVVTTDA